MYNEQKSCPACHNPLIEIDRYGERLLGCIECNRWKWIGSNRPVMELAPDDLEALKGTGLLAHGR
jgi:uncharacterized protein YbaR (Trm112 family)